jgi:menaquinone reductase, multiheme cytochrome c subunit
MFGSGVIAMLCAGWLGFPYVLYEKVEQPIQFSHKAHVETGGMACEDCHSLGENGKFSGIPKISQCATCHEAPLTELAHEKVLVEEYVAKNREIPWLVYSRQPDNTYFPHAPHMKQGKLECERCHGDHGKTESLRPFERNRISGYSRDIWGTSISRISFPGKQPPARPGMKMDDCARCHTEKGLQQSCLDCHK